MPIESKVSNSSTNSVKRLNNDAAIKAETLAQGFRRSQRCEFKELEEHLQSDRLRDLLRAVLQSNVLTRGDSSIWFFLDQVSGSNIGFDKKTIQQFKEQIPFSKGDWQELWSKLTGRGSGNIDEHRIPETHIRKAILFTPPISLIPAIRRIDKGNVQKDDFSGLGLFERLAELQHLSLSQRHLQ